jgi:predicted ATPase
VGLSTELRLSESLQEFQVAVLATEDGRFTFQIFTVCGEPQTLQTDNQRYVTPADAARAGHEAIVSMRNAGRTASAGF